MKIVSIWSSILQVVIQMVNEAMVVPGPYAASAITGSLVSYALYISGEWSTFGVVICIGIAYSLASFEVGAVRTVLKMIRSNRSYKSAVVLAAFALLVEIVIVISAHGKLPWIVIVVSLAFCFLPAIMYALRYMDEYSDEVLDSTRQKEALDVQLELERKRKEQEVELQRLVEQAKWEIEQERIKMQNRHEERLVKLDVKLASKSDKMSKFDALEFLRNNPGMGATEAGNRIGATRQTVHNYRKELGQE